VEVDRTWLWILLAGCSLAGAVRWVAAERRGGAGRPRAERFTVAALTGVGAGMAVATLVLLAAAVVARLG
jgi:hypothetical protein